MSSLPCIVFQQLTRVSADTEQLTNTVSDLADSSTDNAGSSSIEVTVKDLERSKNAFYGAMPSLATRAEFLLSGLTGDITIVTGSGTDVGSWSTGPLRSIDKFFPWAPRGSTQWRL